MKRRHRLSRSRDFDAVYRNGRSTATRYFVLWAFPRVEADDVGPRLGLAVSRTLVRHRATQQRFRVVAFATLTPFFFLRSGMNVSLPLVTKWWAHRVRRSRVAGSHKVRWLTRVVWWNWLRWARSVVATAMPMLPPRLRAIL